MNRKNKVNSKISGSIVFRLLLTFCLISFSLGAYAQKKQVKGVVKDPLGETVIGASVLEKGTTNGTVTDFDGNFVLEVSPDAILHVSYIGYQTQDIPVKGKAMISITLKEDTEVLDEVVVVGYGAQKKESVVGAISQVSSKELLKSPAANVSQALAGKISGVITSQTSGAPGADDADIYIRGRASFAGDNQPLILVDGVERSFSQISPDDIESISVLKDASATAVYGVRGANGVMLITTKRGKEQKPKVSLTANWQIQSPTRKDTYLDSYDSVVLLEEALANDGMASQYSAYDLNMYRKSRDGQLTGLDANLLREGKLEVRPRKGGEKIKLYRLRPSRNLKHLFQAVGVPSFERSKLPLVWLNDRLVYAAGLGTDVRMYADPVLSPERVRLVWVPDKPLLALGPAEDDL